LKLLAPGGQNSISSGSPPQTMLGELTASSRPLSWISGVLLLGEGKEVSRREEGERGLGRRPSFCVR